MPTFLGLDLSLTGTAWALTPGSSAPYEYALVKTSPKDYVDRWVRYEQIAGEICKVIMQRQPAFIVLEDYICNPHNVMTTMALIEMGAVVRARIAVLGLPWMTVVGSQLKKYVTGSGVGHKSVIIKDVYKNFNVDVNDDNLADAVVLATMARDIHGYKFKSILPTQKYRQEVLKKVLDSREVFNGSRWIA